VEKSYPCLWFNHQAREAVGFYSQLFPDTYLIRDQVSVLIFNLVGQKFMALDGNNSTVFNKSFSMVVECDDQAEIDRYWNALIEGGEEQMCCWLKDRYGLSWQIVPKSLGIWMSGANALKVMETLLKMRKPIWHPLEEAAMGL